MDLLEPCLGSSEGLAENLRMEGLQFGLPGYNGGGSAFKMVSRS